jgi:hypothetical protein
MRFRNILSRGEEIRVEFEKAGRQSLSWSIYTYNSHDFPTRLDDLPESIVIALVAGAGAGIVATMAIIVILGRRRATP